MSEGIFSPLVVGSEDFLTYPEGRARAWKPTSIFNFISNLIEVNEGLGLVCLYSLPLAIVHGRYVVIVYVYNTICRNWHVKGHLQWCFWTVCVSCQRLL